MRIMLSSTYWLLVYQKVAIGSEYLITEQPLQRGGRGRTDVITILINHGA